MLSGHGAGKGDKNRTTDEKAFKANYDEIIWSPGLPLDCMNGKKVKHYGPRLPEKIEFQDIGPAPTGCGPEGVE